LVGIAHNGGNRVLFANFLNVVTVQIENTLEAIHIQEGRVVHIHRHDERQPDFAGSSAFNCFEALLDPGEEFLWSPKNGCARFRNQRGQMGCTEVFLDFSFRCINII
jgi:hypothetical protein